MDDTWRVEATTKRKCEWKAERWEVNRSQIMQLTRRAGQEWWSSERQRTFLLYELECRWQPGVQGASYDNSVDSCYAMPRYNPVLQLLRGPSTSRWAGPQSAGSGPSWAGWIQSRHCYCASGHLKLAGETGEGRGDKYRQKVGEGSRGAGVTTRKSRRGWEVENGREKERAEFTHLLFF